MTRDTIQTPTAASGAASPVGRPAGAAVRAGRLADFPTGFEVHVAAAQVWLVMPGQLDCRAMYPGHARALAAALAEVAANGDERRVVLAADASLALAHGHGDHVLIREDTAQWPGMCTVSVPAEIVEELAAQLREAADKAERGAWTRRAR
jgi:hypothetical protein